VSSTRPPKCVAAIPGEAYCGLVADALAAADDVELLHTVVGWSRT
jgi:hypothetical protein